MLLPFDEMLLVWIKLSGKTEADFWHLTWPQYQRWLGGFEMRLSGFTKKRLQDLMERFPDG